MGKASEENNALLRALPRRAAELALVGSSSSSSTGKRRKRKKRRKRRLPRTSSRPSRQIWRRLPSSCACLPTNGTTSSMVSRVRRCTVSEPPPPPFPPSPPPPPPPPTTTTTTTPPPPRQRDKKKTPSGQKETQKGPKNRHSGHFFQKKDKRVKKKTTSVCVCWCVGVCVLCARVCVAVCCCVCLGCADRPLGGPPFRRTALRRTALRRTAQNFALFFFPLPSPFSFFFSLWGSSHGILVVFLKAGTL